MDLYESLQDNASLIPIRCIDMHTTGEATRIVLSGFPSLKGNLLEQRETYRTKHDEYRRKIMLEPRGHDGMYGALLVRDSELIATGEADIAVLYLHNEGYSLMCGHAAIALGRFLVDTHDTEVFPLRESLPFDPETNMTTVRLHTPCGINLLSVPTTPDGRSADSSKPVSFLSVPSFAGALDLVVNIPTEKRWPELIATGRSSVTVNISYGGTWYCMVTADELGFKGLEPGQIEFTRFDNASEILKTHIANTPSLVAQISIPAGIEWYLYGVMVVDANPEHFVPVSISDKGAIAHTEAGLCFFAGQQVDRSPTGGCVAARMALAHAQGVAKLHERRAFHSFVSNDTRANGRGAFIGTNVEEVDIAGGTELSAKGVIVRVEGEAFYTGAVTFVREECDPISDGFSM